MIRLACLGDVPQVAALERTTLEAPRWSDAVYCDYVAAPLSALQQKALFVAVVAHRVQGFAAASAVADVAELESIVVADGAKRSGLGSRLLQSVETWARRAGAGSLELEVRSSNADAQVFYASRGFACCGLRRAYYRDPIEDAVLLRKNLLPAADDEGSAVEGNYN